MTSRCGRSEGPEPQRPGWTPEGRHGCCCPPASACVRAPRRVQFNQAISPLFHVDKIKAPLLIGQGANDPRVKQAEADQIAFSMAAKQIPVECVICSLCPAHKGPC